MGFHDDEGDGVDDTDNENTYETLSVHKGSVDTNVRKVAVRRKNAAAVVIVKTASIRERGVVHIHLKKVLLYIRIR